ncbi:transcriptional regulator domain-containing protein [Caulobacter sp. FWC2]|uniref:transcriptional regulator domain-containing protein n=1 Tax=Caulobacter sp. FWC2 TaxID=69664 RepID=UPI0035131053
MAKSRVAHCHLAPIAPQPASARTNRLDPDQARLAWEFLRRNPEYRSAYRNWRTGATPDLAEHWGLRAPIDPDRQDIDASAIWRAEPSERGGERRERPSERRTICRMDQSWEGSPPASARRPDRSCPCGSPSCRMNA